MITEVTVKLRPARAPEHTVAGYFDSVVDAGRAVAAITAAGLTPSALELVDRTCLEAVDAWKNMGLADRGRRRAARALRRPGRGGRRRGGARCWRTSRPRARRSPRRPPTPRRPTRSSPPAAWPTRRSSASARCSPRTSACPGPRCPRCSAASRTSGGATRPTIANLAHAGDGNLHPLLITPVGDEPARRRAQAAFEEILADALSLGGTVTGEHGVGLLKREGLQREQSPEVLAMQRAVKAALDPHGILNPGKVL